MDPWFMYCFMLVPLELQKSMMIYCSSHQIRCKTHISHDMTKPTKWVASPSLIRVFTVCMKKARILSYPLSAQRRRWSDWADSQADLRLHWAHTHTLLVLSCCGSHNEIHLRLKLWMMDQQRILGQSWVSEPWKKGTHLFKRIPQC